MDTWDRTALREHRRRRGGGLLLVVALALLVAAIIYQFMLRPSGVRLPARARSLESDSFPPPAKAAPSEADRARAATTEDRAAPPQPSDSLHPAAAPESLSPGSLSTASGVPVAVMEAEPADTTRGALSAVRPDSSSAEDRRTTPPVTAAPRDSGASRSEAPVSSPTAAPRTSAPRSSSPAGPSVEVADATPPASADAGFVIHLSSFKVAAEAEREAVELLQHGIEVRTLRVDVPERGTWYRNVTGNFASFAQAESAALALQARGVIPYAHIAGNGGLGTPIPVGTLDRIRP